MRINYDLDSMRLEDNEITAGTARADQMRNFDVAALEAYSASRQRTRRRWARIRLRSSRRSGRTSSARLKAGPSLMLDPLRFRYDDEPFEGRIEITTNTARLPPAGTLSVDNWLLLLSLMNVDADVRVSKTLATNLATLAARLQLAGDLSIPPDQLDYMAEAQSGLMLTILIGQGVLVEDGDDYRTSLEYTRRRVDVERQPATVRLAVAQSSASVSGAASSADASASAPPPSLAVLVVLVEVDGARLAAPCVPRPSSRQVEVFDLLRRQRHEFPEPAGEAVAQTRCRIASSSTVIVSMLHESSAARFVRDSVLALQAGALARQVIAKTRVGRACGK